MLSQSSWYVLFVMGGKEKQITDFINQETEIGHAFIPMIEQIHTKKGKEYVVEKAMFPSYVFIDSIVSSREFQEQMKLIKQRKAGIIKELKYDEETSALRDEERRYLEGLLDLNYILVKSVGYMIGDKVKITEGALQGYENQIMKINRHKKKAWLRLNLLYQEIQISVSLEIVKKI